MSATDSPATAPATGRRATALAMLVAAVIPLAVMVGSGAGFVLDPRERGWLMHGDSAQHLVAWSFYAREPWQWPPAAIERWPAPLGTTIGLADAIPLVAMPLKAIAGERAADLQYFGLWSALCLATLGATSALFLLEARGGPLLAALGGGLVALSPVVWDRLTRGHPSLAAHALLAGLFVTWLRYHRSGGGWRPLAAACGLIVVAAGIHPYLMLMGAGLLVAMVASVGVRTRPPALGRRLCAIVGALLAAAGASRLCGFLALPARDLSVSGFGGYESDLLAPLHSAGFSRWLPSWFEAGASREGFGYLGLGALVLGALAVAGFVADRLGGQRGSPGTNVARGRIAGLRELAATTVLLALFAMVPFVSVGGHRIVDLSRVLSPLEPVFDVVRANGRFAWPLHLLLILGAVLGVRRFAERPPLAAGLLLGALALQLADGPSWPWGRAGNDPTSLPIVARIAASAPSDDRFRRLVQIPAYLKSGSGLHCGSERDAERWVPLALLAARRGWSFNSGHLARAGAEAARRACREATVEAVLAAPRADSIYQVPARQARELTSRTRGIRCVRLSTSERLCWRPAGDERAASRRPFRTPRRARDPATMAEPGRGASKPALR